MSSHVESDGKVTFPVSHNMRILNDTRLWKMKFSDVLNQNAGNKLFFNYGKMVNVKFMLKS